MELLSIQNHSKHAHRHCRFPRTPPHLVHRKSGRFATMQPEGAMYVREPLPHSRPFVFHVLFVIIVLVGFLPFSTASAFEGSGEPPHIFMEEWPTGEADEPRQIIVHREDGFFALRSASFPMRILASQSFRQGKTDVITTLVEVDDDVDLATAIQEIEAQPGVLYAEPNYPVYLFAAPYPNDYYFSDQWGMAPYDGE